MQGQHIVETHRHLLLHQWRRAHPVIALCRSLAVQYQYSPIDCHTEYFATYAHRAANVSDGRAIRP